MNKTLGEYFRVARNQAANALQPEPRKIPTLENVSSILSAMPTKYGFERRDRAIVAASFLFGTRSNATASLRLMHVDVKAGKIYLDANIVRVKNSKSQTVKWFPVGEQIERVVVSWINELGRLGFGPEDALFPPDAFFGYQASRPANRTSSG